MRVLVSGAGGFLGRHVVDRLLQRGHVVRAILRPAAPAPPWPRDVEIFRADLRVDNRLVAAFADVGAVVHLAATVTGSEDVQFASTVVATERFLEAMVHASVKRIVHVSSLVVYDWSRARRIMDEDTPLLANAYEMGGYTIAKTWQERVVARYAKAYSLDLTVMRPGFIWGPDHAELAGMGRHLGRLYLMFGPRTRLPLTHVVNCADCLVAAAESQAAIGQTFNVIDDDDVRVWRYVAEFARRTGRRGVMMPIPYRVGLGVAQLAALTSGALYGRKGKLPSLLMPRRFEQQFKPIRFSNRKVASLLGWKPRLSFAECLDVSFP